MPAEGTGPFVSSVDARLRDRPSIYLPKQSAGMEDTIRQIRTRLRLAMDGAVSASMRNKGVHYKLNFGVTLPRLKAIASDFVPNAELARYLWQQDIREFKILATLLYPPGEFTPGQADEWVGQIRYMEIAEQFCANLMQQVAFAPEAAARWIGHTETDDFVSTAGYILYARLFLTGRPIPASDAAVLLRTAAGLLEGPFSRPQQAAVTALKRYGRQSAGHAAEVLQAFGSFRTSNSRREREIYEDLKFEFDYSR